ALLFGSSARMEERTGSDIDILVVDGKTEEKELKKKETLYGKISIHKISKKELRKRWHTEPIYKRIWKDRILLKNPQNFWSFALEEGKA
ncbi:MAG: nucleotidyltransferase domain-containing protein, partial [Candidatus ainarchaeum sp.]|nr:nucleotidyltransferase domain-containing protein [Candidatus ainarchaeum sp.]